MLNTNPDPGFWCPKTERKKPAEIFFFFNQKLQFTYPLVGLHNGRQSYQRSLQLSKETIQHFKKGNYLISSNFLGHFCPPGSGSAFRIRIRIHWPNSIRIQLGPGSETLLYDNSHFCEKPPRPPRFLQVYATLWEHHSKMLFRPLITFSDY